MTTAVDSKSFSGISANTPTFKLKGGYYMVAAVGTFTTVELQAVGPDGSTLLSLPTALKLTAAGMIAGYLPPGQYQFTVTATSATVSVAGVPIS